MYLVRACVGGGGRRVGGGGEWVWPILVSSCILVILLLLNYKLLAQLSIRMSFNTCIILQFCMECF